MNVGDKIPEILGIDQDGLCSTVIRRLTPADALPRPAPCRLIRRNWQQPVTRLSA